MAILELKVTVLTRVFLGVFTFWETGKSQKFLEIPGNSRNLEISQT